jgi:hypothetical protein
VAILGATPITGIMARMINRTADRIPSLRGRIFLLACCLAVGLAATAAAPVDGEPTLLFRATHAHGDIYLRYSLDRDGRISRLVWWHL